MKSGKMTYEKKKELSQTQNITLDGKPAIISGLRTDFALVRQIGGYGFEWAWESVQNVIEKGGNFKS